MFQKCCPCLTLEFFAQYFDVSTDDITKRLMYSLLPFNGRFHAVYMEKPDLYGPFWIYTTLVIVLAIAGNLSRYLQMGSAAFTYNYNFVPIAATVIYSIGFGLPLALKVLMRFLGSNFFNGTFIEVRTLIMSNCYYLDSRNIRILLHKFLDYSVAVCDTNSSTIVGVRRIFSCDISWVSHSYILEGPQL